MTLSPAIPPTETQPVHGIIFPQGDFWSDEPPLETKLHLEQIILLLKCLEWLWKDRQDFFAAGNLTIYYSPKQKKSEDFRGPDFFVALGVEKDETRKSWVVWEEEGKYPNVIVEILSDSTAEVDRGEKKKIYQDTFRTPDYFWFDPVSLEFKGFRLMGGKYEEIEANEQGWLWSQQLELYLGIREGKLRYFSEAGNLIPSPEEAAIQEQERAQQAQLEAQQAQLEVQQAQLEAQQERDRAEKLAARLRSLGIDPEDI